MPPPCWRWNLWLSLGECHLCQPSQHCPKWMLIVGYRAWHLHAGFPRALPHTPHAGLVAIVVMGETGYPPLNLGLLLGWSSRFSCHYQSGARFTNALMMVNTLLTTIMIVNRPHWYSPPVVGTLVSLLVTTVTTLSSCFILAKSQHLRWHFSLDLYLWLLEWW